MMNFDSNKAAAFGAAMQSNRGLEMGKTLENYWLMQAYGPVALDDFIKACGQRWNSHIQAIVESMAGLRDGRPVLPLARLRKRLVPALPAGLFDELEVLLWADGFANLVTTAGKNDSLDKHFKGSGYTAAWYVGLTEGTPTFDAADTMASHSGWVEETSYDEAARQTLTLGSVSAGSVDNSASRATFTIDTNSTVIGGGFINTVSTKGGSTGTLYGGGAFSAGNKTLDDNDSLLVTVTLTAS